MIGLTEKIDLAIILLYAFWIFFFILVAYLNREGMREGFPVESEITGKPDEGGLLGLPTPKTFLLANGKEIQAPHPEVYEDPAKAQPIAPWSGAPLAPTGDPMLSEFGPGAYAQRADEPLLTYHDELKIAPLRDMPDFSIVERDTDPRGLPVLGADNARAGEVVDIWIDREEQMIRYLEVALDAPVGGEGAEGAAVSTDTVLLPITMASIGGRYARMGVWRPEVKVIAIMGAQFKDVPRLANPAQVTLLEEDKITAYYGGGFLFATAARQETML